MYLMICLLKPLRAFTVCCCLLVACHAQAANTEQFFAYFNAGEFAKAAALYTYPFHMSKPAHDKALRITAGDLKELFAITGAITLGESVGSEETVGLDGLAASLAMRAYVKSNTASQKFFAASTENVGAVIVNVKYEMFRQEPLAVYVYFLKAP